MTNFDYLKMQQTIHEVQSHANKDDWFCKHIKHSYQVIGREHISIHELCYRCGDYIVVVDIEKKRSGFFFENVY